MNHVRIVRRPYPTLLILVWLALGLQLAVLQTWGELLLCTAILGWLHRLVRGNSSAFILRIAIPFGFVYMVVGSLFPSPGDAVQWHSAPLPFIGTISVSAASLMRSAFHVLRMLDILMLFVFIGVVTTTEDIAHWFGRRYSRFALTIGMVVRLIPTLLAERSRISEMVRLRAQLVDSTPLRTRVRTTAVVYQTLLANTLERAWRLAESMFVRGYGVGKRTLYSNCRWHVEDTALAACVVVWLTVMAAYRMYDLGGIQNWIGIAVEMICAGTVIGFTGVRLRD